MGILTNAIKTKYKGIYRKNTKDGEAYIIRYSVNKKTTTKYIGFAKHGMSPKKAFTIKLDEMSIKMISEIDEFEQTYQFLPLFEEFIKYRSHYLSKNTNRNYNSIFNVYIKPTFVGKDIRDITKIDLQKYINKLLIYKRPSTIEKVVYALNGFFKYLQDIGIAVLNPASFIILPQYDNKKYFTISKKDVHNFVNYIMNIDNQLYKTIYVLLLHGRRISEILSLKWKDIDFLSKVYILEYTNVKNRKNQYYHLSDFQYDELVKLKRMANNKAIYVFENKNTKKPITYTSIFRIHKKLRIDLNMPHYNLHSVRHTVAFLLINNGYSLEIISKVLGHRSISSTQRYATLEVDKARDAYNNIVKTMFFA